MASRQQTAFRARTHQTLRCSQSILQSYENCLGVGPPGGPSSSLPHSLCYRVLLEQLATACTRDFTNCSVHDIPQSAARIPTVASEMGEATEACAVQGACSPTISFFGAARRRGRGWLCTLRQTPETPEIAFGSHYKMADRGHASQILLQADDPSFNKPGP